MWRNVKIKIKDIELYKSKNNKRCKMSLENCENNCENNSNKFLLSTWFFEEKIKGLFVEYCSIEMKRNPFYWGLSHEDCELYKKALKVVCEKVISELN